MSHAIHIRRCPQCARLFVRERSAATCSAECRTVRAGWVSMLARGKRVLKGREPRPCKHCTQTYTPRHGSSVYCSRKCRKAYEEAKYGKFQGTFTNKMQLDALCEREHWHCHICKKRVLRSQASADHLVPRSLGGPDELTNLRLAHVSCNSKRGAGRIPAQLMLVER